MARTARHAPEPSKRTYRNVPVWRDLALLALVVAVAMGWFLTWAKFA